jgi:aryl-alcohol dehydrogenase-like predicted oxidoreductase
VEYVRLDATDLEVSRLCLGGWQIGGLAFGHVPDDEVERIFLRALDLGVNFFDLAPSYGRTRAEELAGRLLPHRDDVVVATKVGLSWGEDLVVHPDLSPASIRREIEESLRRLRRETIDLYLVHWPDPATPIADSFATLEALRAEGKIRYLGVCNYEQPELHEVVRHAAICALQSRYNLLQQENRDDIDFCRERGMAFLAHSSLATGLLTGKYADGVQFEDGRSRFDLFRGEGLKRALARVAELKEEAAARGTSVLSMALAFILDTPGVHVAVVGTRSPEQLEGAVRAVYP